MTDLDNLYFSIFGNDDISCESVENELSEINILIDLVFESEENENLQESSVEDLSKMDKKKKVPSKVKLVALISAIIVLSILIIRFLKKQKKNTDDKELTMKYDSQIDSIEKMIAYLKSERDDIRKSKDAGKDVDLIKKENNINRTIKRYNGLMNDIKNTIKKSGNGFSADDHDAIDQFLKYNEKYMEILKKYTYNI